jgi:hypothetical protein
MRQQTPSKRAQTPYFGNSKPFAVSDILRVLTRLPARFATGAAES